MYKIQNEVVVLKFTFLRKYQRSFLYIIKHFLLPSHERYYGAFFFMVSYKSKYNNHIDA